MTKIVARLFLASLCVVAVPLAAGQPKVGAPAPDFTLTLFDRSKVALDDLRGKVVILNFWATWCGPCKHEMPLLDGYYRARKDAGLAIFAVATEDSLSPAQLRPLAAILSFPMARAIRGPIRRWARSRLTTSSAVTERCATPRPPPSRSTTSTRCWFRY